MNEIVTFGKGYKLNTGIKIFAQSATKLTNTTVTVIGVDLDPDTHLFLKNTGVNIVDGNEIAKKYNVNLQLSPYTLKVIFFRLYCKYYTTAEKLYFCDFTDVYFQPKDLFEVVAEKNIAYVSGEKNLIKNCDTNKTWIKICYNSDILNLLWNKEILNGGTILGYKSSCLYLLDEMCKDMGSIIGRVGNYQNIDQASLNKCVYFDEAKYVILQNNEILNCAHQGNLPVTNIDGIYKLGSFVPYVIHQYDVIKSLEHTLNKIYG
jgi:hypothetical protein